MFGIDAYSLEVLIPSLIGVFGMAAVMGWGFFKVKHLMEDDSPSK